MGIPQLMDYDNPSFLGRILYDIIMPEQIINQHGRLKILGRMSFIYFKLSIRLPNDEWMNVSLNGQLF